jgi:hypothetical protein
MLTYGNEAWTTHTQDESRIMTEDTKSIRRMAGYICLDYKKNLAIMKELNAKPNTEFIKITDPTGKPMFCHLLENSIPSSPLPTKEAKFFGKTLQTLIQDHNMPLGLRCGRSLLLLLLLMMKKMKFNCLLFAVHQVIIAK